MRRRARVVGLLLLASTFLVGGAAGMAAEEWLGLDWFDFLDEDVAPSEARLFTGLALTPAQRVHVAAVVERREQRLEAYWKGRLPDIRAIMEDSYGEMRAVLTADQAQVFDARVRVLRRRISTDRD